MSNVKFILWIIRFHAHMMVGMCTLVSDTRTHTHVFNYFIREFLWYIYKLRCADTLTSKTYTFVD